MKSKTSFPGRSTNERRDTWSRRSSTLTRHQRRSNHAQPAESPDDDSVTSGAPVWPPSPTTEETAEQATEISPELLAKYRRESICATVIYFLFNLLLPLIKLPRSISFGVESGLTIVTTAIFMYLQLYLARSIVRTRRSVGLAIGLAMLFVVLWLCVVFVLNKVHFHGHYFVLTLLLLNRPVTGLLLTLALTNFGTVLSRIIREPNVLFAGRIRSHAN